MVLLIILIFLSIVLYLGIPRRSGKTSTVSDHVIAGRSLGLWPIFFIGVAEFYSAGTFLGFPGWAYSLGAPVLFSLVAIALSSMMGFWLGPKVWRVGKKFGLVTQAQFLSTRYQSKPLGAMAAIVAIFALIANLTLQMMGAGYIFEVSTQGQVPYWLGSLIAFGVVAVYVTLGGLRSISTIAIFKGLFMLGIILTIAVVVVNRYFEGLEDMYRSLALDLPSHLTLSTSNITFGYAFWTTSILVSLLGVPMGSYLFVNFYSAKEPRLIRKTAVIAPVYALAVYAVLIIGFAGALVKPDLDESDTIMLVMILEIAPLWLVGLLCAGGLSAAMVAGSAMSLAAASTVGNDLLRPYIDMKDATLKRIIQILIFFVIGLAYAFSISKPATITYISLIALGIGVQFLPLVVGAFYSKRATGWGAMAGLMTGIATLAWFTFGPEKNPFGVHAGLIGLVTNTLMFSIVSRLTPTNDDDIVAEFKTAAAEAEPELANPGWERKFQVGALLLVVAAVWPVVTIFNHIEPFIAGQPLLVFYSVSFAFTVALFLAFMYRLSRTETSGMGSEIK
jgi:SSS family solute:Na+ symporter